MAKYGLYGYNVDCRPNAPDPPAPKPSPQTSRNRLAANGSKSEVPESEPQALYRVVDNWKSLSDIREALGPDLLSQLPMLDQLVSRPMGRVRPFDRSPLSFHIGYLITPDQESPYLLLPIYMSVGTRDQAPLNVYTPTEESLTDIITREFEAVENVAATTFFQSWETFEKYVHIHPCFLKPQSWNDLKALITYCLLLAWAAESPRTIWDPIPTHIDIADILADLCRGEQQLDVGNSSEEDDDRDSDDRSDDDNDDGDGDDDGPPSNEVLADDAQQPHSLPPEATDRLIARPSARMLAAIRRKQPDSLSHPARKRQAMQRETEETGEEVVKEEMQDQPSDGSQDNSTQDTTQTTADETHSNVALRIQSIKPQYRRPGTRAETPPRPDHEPLAPPRASAPAALMGLALMHVAAAPLLTGEIVLSDAAGLPYMTQPARDSVSQMQR